MKHAFLLLAAPLLVSACVAVPVPVEQDLCGAEDLQYLVGQPGVVLDRMRFSTDVRVIQPGTSVTMDYRSDRLNIYLNRYDVIERVACG